MIREVVLAALALAVPLRAAVADGTAHLSPRQTEAVERYERDTRRLASGDKRATVEIVFDDALRIRRLLARAPDNSLEDLSAADYTSLQRRLPGIILNREEVILADPDPAYFASLAAKYGAAVDRDFFDRLRATVPDGVWPAYIEQQTDVTGCTRFGEGELVRAYRRWTDFKRLHARYRASVDDFIQNVEDGIVSRCACGDRDSVLRELREFAAAFPRSRVHEAVVARIREIMEGKPVVRFDCLSG